MHTEAMIRTHPAINGRVDANQFRCIEECLDCDQTCTSCADACLSEEACTTAAGAIKPSL